MINFELNFNLVQTTIGWLHFVVVGIWTFKCLSTICCKYCPFSIDFPQHIYQKPTDQIPMGLFLHAMMFHLLKYLSLYQLFFILSLEINHTSPLTLFHIF